MCSDRRVINISGESNSQIIISALRLYWNPLKQNVELYNLFSSFYSQQDVPDQKGAGDEQTQKQTQRKKENLVRK